MDRKATFIAWRYFVYALISVAGILVPALGILKIDAAYGNHYWLFEPVEWTVVGKMFTYYLIVFKVLILLTTGYVGRLFCGWFCPGGMLGMFNLRITEKFTIRKGKRRIRKWSYYLVHAGVALAFTLITMNWFIDLRVLLDNGAGAFAGSWIATGTVLVLSFLYSAFVGYNFCKTWCPSGWYFKLISQKNPIGIKFENHDGRCIT
jgi:ferredoxin-type protein NapH